MIDGIVCDVAHQDTNQALMANHDRIFIPVDFLFLIQKVHDALLRFFSSLSLGKAKISLSLAHSLPFGRKFRLNIFFGCVVEQAVVDLVQAFVYKRNQVQVSGQWRDGLPRPYLGADINP